MKIDDQDLYHGSALAQIARNRAFTAINVSKGRGAPSRSSFFVNDDLAIYLKYGTMPKGTAGEYLFTFNKQHFDEIKKLQAKRGKCFIVLVCVQDREICCVLAEKLHELRELRETELGHPEKTFTLLATLPKGKQFRVYVNQPRTKGKMLGDILVPRNAFPDALFE